MPEIDERAGRKVKSTQARYVTLGISGLKGIAQGKKKTLQGKRFA